MFVIETSIVLLSGRSVSHSPDDDSSQRNLRKSLKLRLNSLIVDLFVCALCRISWLQYDANPMGFDIRYDFNNASVWCIILFHFFSRPPSTQKKKRKRIMLWALCVFEFLIGYIYPRFSIAMKTIFRIVLRHRVLTISKLKFSVCAMHTCFCICKAKLWIDVLRILEKITHIPRIEVVWNHPN